MTAWILNNGSEWSDGPYSISDIQDYFGYIIKKHETLIGNPPVQIFVNRIDDKKYSQKQHFWMLK